MFAYHLGLQTNQLRKIASNESAPCIGFTAFRLNTVTKLMLLMVYAPLQPLCISLSRGPSTSNLRYDTSTVIDLVHSADLYLWGGAGFSSGKVSYLWTQRDEKFKGKRRRLDNLDTFQSISNLKLRLWDLSLIQFYF